MPANPRKEEMMCWRDIHEEIQKINRTQKPKDYDTLILQCIRLFPVSEQQVRAHIERFYINKETVTLQEGNLMPGAQQ